MKLNSLIPRGRGLALFVVCSAISLIWGLTLSSRSGNGSSGFQAVYYGTRCLLQHHDPYQQSQLDAVYQAAEGGSRSGQPSSVHDSITLYVNLPTTFVCLAPLALLPYALAHAIWMLLLAVLFNLAALLAWNLAAPYAPRASLLLISFMAANAEIIYSTGNTAGIVVSLCVIAVWCLVRNQYPLPGAIFLGVALAIKPHDVGLVWLFFVLAGGVFRKRALQSVLITALLSLTAFFWVSHVAPGWIHDWRANLEAISGPGGINQPGPHSISNRSPDMVVDLQSVVSVFKDNPDIYNPVSYVVCGLLLLLWSIRTLRSRVSLHTALLAFAAVVPLTILITYHRAYDAKLLFITLPAFALLQSGGGRVARIALLLTTLAVIFTADIPLAVLTIVAGKLHLGFDSLSTQLVTVLLLRPAPLVLLAMAVFYMWSYLKLPAAISGSELTEAPEKN